MVFGAAEAEKPVCAKSWWNMGHAFALDCRPLKLWKLSKINAAERSSIKDKAAKVKLMTAFLLIFYILPFLGSNNGFTERQRPKAGKPSGGYLIAP